MVFKVELTDSGWASYQDCLDYLVYSVGGAGNIQAAINFLNDFGCVFRYIEQGALGYPIMEDPELEFRQLRKVHFPRMSYKALYRVIGSNAYIEFVMHDRQAFENIELD